MRRARGAFDLLTLEETYTEEAKTSHGTERLHPKERRWLPPELIALFPQAGFTARHVWGGTSSHWARSPLSLDEPEIMVVASRR